MTTGPTAGLHRSEPRGGTDLATTPFLVEEQAAWLSATWARLTFLVALVAAIAGGVGLLAAGDVYRREAVPLADAAAAQDLVTLAVVAPLLVVLTILARCGSLPAFLSLLGCLEFTVYNSVIYSFSIGFGPLFLVWVAMLGLSSFALVGVLASADLRGIAGRFAGQSFTGTARFLIVLATMFALLWLSEIVPDLLAGEPSRSAAEWNVPTNPVHVLDLALFLPAVVITGVLLRRRHPLGYATAVGQLVCLALICLPILAIPAVAQARGHAVEWGVLLPIGIVLVATLAVLRGLLQHLLSNRGRRPVAD